MGEDFPFVCDRCLGDNKFMRMIKIPNHDACKISKKPYTVFRWRPSRKSPVFNRTLCSYEIAAEKNICQCCLNDLTYGVPVALRDQFVSSQSGLASSMGTVPLSETNQAYYFQQKLANRENKLFIRDSTKQKTASDHLNQMSCEFKQRQNEIHIEEQTEVFKEKQKKKKQQPKDETITTLFLSNIPTTTTEEDIQKLLSIYGNIERIYMLVQKNSCFVEFSKRIEAERAVFNLENKFIIQEKKVFVSWAFSHDPYHQKGIEKRKISQLLEEAKANITTKKQKINNFTSESTWIFPKDEIKGTFLDKMVQQRLAKMKES